MAKKIIKGVGKVASALIGGKKKAAADEAPEPVMPMADDEAVKRARKKSIAAQLNRGGRSSTILSDGDSLGGY